VWIVHLEGGGWCYDTESCAQRCADSTNSLCSSHNWLQTVPKLGIFYPTDSTLRAANKVFVPYCTSDGHMGDAIWDGKQFRGNKVIQAVFRHLVEKRGLGQGPNQDLVIFGGSSAGGRGAMVHLDFVSRMIGPEAAARVTVKGFLDSPFWIDIPPFEPKSFVGFNETTDGVFQHDNVTASQIPEQPRPLGRAHLTQLSLCRSLTSVNRVPRPTPAVPLGSACLVSIVSLY